MGPSTYHQNEQFRRLSKANAFTLIHNLFGGDDIPPTPAIPCHDDLPQTEILRSRASLLGHVVGFSQEQSGQIIQNIVPNHKTEYQQISTSSRTQLELHTETAFHPYRPDYVLLMCLRGDIEAFTTVAGLGDILRLLDEETKTVLAQPIFTTSLDLSFQNEDQPDKEIATAILSPEGIVYDRQLMRPTCVSSEDALEALGTAVGLATRRIALMTGDLLVINNRKCVHGRASFQPRYDGTDRWLQRALVRSELPGEDQRVGNVITTSF